MKAEDINRKIEERLNAIEDSLKTVSEIIADIQAQKQLVSYLMLLKNDGIK